MINNYKDLTIAKYQELLSMDWESMEELDRQVSLISVLDDKDEEEILNLPLTEYTKLAAQTEFLLKEPEVKRRKPNKVKINGREYDIVKEVKDMTAGQYIDYQQYLALNDINKFLPNILSCFIIPKGKKYGEYNIDDAINDIKCMSVEEALSIASFFMRKFRTSIEGILLYLRWNLKMVKRKTKDETVKNKIEIARENLQSLHNLIKNGDGFLV
jgi:hypothetical protein